MIILSLGQSIMYVSMVNLIQCMGDMALMPKICENSHFLLFFMFFFYISSQDMTPYVTPDAILSLGHSGIGCGVIFGLQRSQNSSKIRKKAIFHIFWALKPYHSYIESNFSLVHT